MLADIHKLKPVSVGRWRKVKKEKLPAASHRPHSLRPPPTIQTECVKLTRKNEGLHPMDAGGEAALEALARKADCGLFALATHTKKRPHALTLGRFFDGRLLDAVEMTLDSVTTIAETGAAAAAARTAAGHKPLLFFAGAPFDAAGGDPAMVAARSLLLDLFRGRVVQAINLAVSWIKGWWVGDEPKTKGRSCFPRLPQPKHTRASTASSSRWPRAAAACCCGTMPLPSKRAAAACRALS